jgi:alkylmercury lyase
MSSIEHDNDADLAEFTAGWRTAFRAAVEGNHWVTVTYAVIGLANFGEHPVQSTRLAGVSGRTVGEAEALARRWGWPGTRVENGIITVNPERAKAAPRRHVRVGDRRFGVTGCAPDVFYYAPLVRPSLHLEETCPVTGTPIRIVFTPDRVESVDPGGTVLPMPQVQQLAPAGAAGDIEEVDANVCAQGPFFSSAEAAQGWLAGHPGGRVFPIREAWDLSFFGEWRDRMSALLGLGN